MAMRIDYGRALMCGFLLYACGGKAAQATKDMDTVARGGAAQSSGVGGTTTTTSTSTGGAHPTDAPGQGGAGAIGGSITPGEELVPVTPEELAELTKDACFGTESQAQLLPEYTLVLADTSRSMNFAAPRFDAWDIYFVREGLTATFRDWTGLQSVALSFFPAGETHANRAARLDSAACLNSSADLPFPSGTSRNSNESLLKSIAANAAGGLGGSPLRDAYAHAVSMLLPHAQWTTEIVLLTGGQPTLDSGCFGDDNVFAPESLDGFVADVGAARAQNIRTLVIGTPTSAQTIAGIDARPWLSRAGHAGGFDAPGCTDDGPNFCHVDLSNSADPIQDVVAAFDKLRSSPGIRVPCVFEIPSAPAGQSVDPERAVITVDTADQRFLIAHDQSGQCSAGWEYVGNDQIRLCDSTCERLKTMTIVGTAITAPCTSGEGP